MHLRKLLKWTLAIAGVAGGLTLWGAGSLEAQAPAGAGYAPDQPVAFSHAFHTSTLRLDCRYCHTLVEQSPKAGIPPESTCMGCHHTIRPNSIKLRPLREAWAQRKAMAWAGVWVLPEDVRFSHDVHVNTGVACETCHGRVDQMFRTEERVVLNESGCLDCHREPERFIRPRAYVLTMGYQPTEDPVATGLALKQELGLDPPLHCSGCHQ